MSQTSDYTPEFQPEFDDYTAEELGALPADVQQALMLDEAARYRSWASQLRYGDDLVSPEMEQQQAYWQQIYTLEDRALALEARAQALSVSRTYTDYSAEEFGKLPARTQAEVLQAEAERSQEWATQLRAGQDVALPEVVKLPMWLNRADALEHRAETLRHLANVTFMLAAAMGS